MVILGIKEIIEISKPRIVILLVITAVTSMYAASKLIGPELEMWGLLHIIIAGAFFASCSIEPDLDKLPIIQPSLGFSVYQESITLNDVDILTGDSSITKESYGNNDSIFVFTKVV